MRLWRAAGPSHGTIKITTLGTTIQEQWAPPPRRVVPKRSPTGIQKVYQKRPPRQAPRRHPTNLAYDAPRPNQALHGFELGHSSTFSRHRLGAPESRVPRSCIDRHVERCCQRRSQGPAMATLLRSSWGAKNCALHIPTDWQAHFCFACRGAVILHTLGCPGLPWPSRGSRRPARYHHLAPRPADHRALLPPTNQKLPYKWVP